MILSVKNSVLIGIILLECVVLFLIPGLEKQDIGNAFVNKEAECNQSCIELNYTDYFYGEGKAGITCYCKPSWPPEYIDLD